MAKPTARTSDDFVTMYVKTSTRRMIVGTIICLAIMGFGLFLTFPTCSRYDTVTAVREVSGKYYLTLQGESGVFGMWSDTPSEAGDRICIQPTFAQ